MRKRIATWVTLVGGLLAILSTISLALYLAHRQSVAEESAATSAMARELLHRADAMGDEALAAYRQLDQAHLADACSDAGLVLMRNIGMRARYLQAVGHIRDGQLRCSSFGRYGDGLALGPVAYVTEIGTRIRPAVDLGLGKDRQFLVLELGDYAAAIKPSTLLDVFNDKPDVALGLYGLKSGIPLATRGSFDAGWATRKTSGDSYTFFDGRYLVAIQHSSRFDTAAYAALPAAHITKRVRELSMLLLPLALLLGIGLSALVFLLARRRNSLPSALRHALHKREFVLHYQPIIALQSGSMVGVEALMRWTRDGTPVRPDLFIPAAEECGLIGQFTEYVLNQVAKDAPRFLADHPDCYISINISPADLHGGRIVDSLKRLVAHPEIPAANIMVEVTEHSFVDAERAGITVKAIRALGIRVAIDDFGTGFSSLSQLTRLETDCLKIDKVFIEAIGTKSATAEVALHIIHMAESLGLTVIGEGIETEAQASFLREYGVNYGQGWLYARALPMSELLRTYA